MKTNNTGIHKLDGQHYIEMQSGKVIAVVCRESSYSKGRIYRNDEGFESTLKELLSNFVWSKEVRDAIAEDKLALSIMEEVS